jgi:hypothetical protein
MMENKKILIIILALIVMMLFHGANLIMENEWSLTGWILIFLSAGIFLIVLSRYEKKS